MIPTAVIMAIAVESAPTRTEVRRNDPNRLRDARSRATPDLLTMASLVLMTQVIAAGSARVPAAMAKTVAKYPKRGFPAIAGAFAEMKEAKARIAAIARSRFLWTRTINSLRPRAMASMGAICAASRAGA